MAAVAGLCTQPVVEHALDPLADRLNGHKVSSRSRVMARTVAHCAIVWRRAQRSVLPLRFRGTRGGVPLRQGACAHRTRPAVPAPRHRAWRPAWPRRFRPRLAVCAHLGVGGRLLRGFRGMGGQRCKQARYWSPVASARGGDQPSVRNGLARAIRKPPTNPAMMILPGVHARRHSCSAGSCGRRFHRCASTSRSARSTRRLSASKFMRPLSLLPSPSSSLSPGPGAPAAAAWRACRHVEEHRHAPDGDAGDQASWGGRGDRRQPRHPDACSRAIRISSNHDGRRTR